MPATAPNIFDDWLKNTADNYQAPQRDPSLIERAQSTNATATNATAQGYTAQGYDPTSYDATTGQTQDAEATLREVDSSTETMQGQLAGIIDQNSPLLQRARSKAQEQMNARGLLNSSMAIGAAQGAVYDYAAPIAEFDARVYGEAARDNQMYLNQVSQFNAGQANAMEAANIGHINRAREFGANAQNMAAEFGANAANQARQFSANAANQVSIENARNQTNVSRTNADNATAVSRTNAAAYNAALDANYEASWRTALAGADARQGAALQQMRTSSEAYMSQVNAEIAADQHATSEASAMMQQYQVAATNIATSNLEPEAKAEALRNLRLMTQQGISVADALAQLDLEAVVDWDELTPQSELQGNVETKPSPTSSTPAAAPAPAPAPAPTPAPFFDNDRESGGRIV